MADGTTLLAAAAARDRLVDRTVHAFDGVARRTLADVFRTAVQTIGGLDPQPGDVRHVAPSTRNRFVAMALDSTLRRTLDAAGWRDTLDRTLTDVTDRLARLTPTAPVGIIQRSRGWVAGQVDTLMAETDRLAGDIRALVTRAVDAGQDLAEVILEVQELVDAVPARLRTRMDTAAMEWAQLLELDDSSAPAGATAYAYVGPVDDRCRPFCLGRVARVFTRPTIDRMDNRQLPNTFLTRGGWNCRHVWRNVTGTPLAALADTGAFLPGAEARVHAVLLAKGARSRYARAQLT